MKQIFLLRHAKSDWSIMGQQDFDRGLASRGIKDISLISEYVKKNNRENGTAIVGIELKFSKDLNDLVKKMKENGFFGEYLNEKPETLRFLI